MSDYVVKFTGKDDLSNTVKNIKKELGDIGTTGKTAMDKIDAKFQKITQSTAPLKRQLRDLQNLIGEMNFKGLNNTDQFTKIAAEAGRIKDAISDASEAVTRFSDDTMGLKATIEAFQGVAAAGSVATGAMALFGSENKQAVILIQKVQGALAVLNGVQTIANMLNENSTLILKMKQIAQVSVNRSTVANTTSTTANTAATTANTIATQANEKAQKTMNTALGAGKLAIGGWLAVITVGIGLLSAYSAQAAKTKAAQAEMNSIIEQSKQTQKSYTDVLSNTYGQLMAKYTQLRNEYIKLSNEHQKVEWIKTNKTELDNLHLSIDGVNSADNAFVNNTSAVVEGFMKRAKAAAYAAQLQDLYAKEAKIKMEISSDAQNSGRTAREGDEITDETFRSSRYGSVNSAGKWVFSKQGAALYSGNAGNNNPQLAQNTRDINNLKGIMDREGLFDNPSTTTSTSSTGTTRTGRSNTVKPSPVEGDQFAAGSLSDLEKQLSDLQKKLKDGLIPVNEIDKTKENIENLKTDIFNKKIELGFETDPNIKSIENIKDKIKNDVEKLMQEEIPTSINTTNSSFDTAMGVNQFDTSTLQGIERVMDLNDNLISGLENTRDNLEMVLLQMAAVGDIGSESWNKVYDKLNQVNEKIVETGENQVELTNKAKDLKQAQEIDEERVKTLNNISDAAQNAGNMISSMASVSDDKGTKTAAIIAEAIANIVAGYASASAQAGGTLGPWGWAAFSLAGLAQVAAMISQIHSLSGYAEGGIISGGSTHGDNILARVNAGEMILNPRQQSNLFKAIDNGSLDFGGGSNSFYVDWRIKGSDLYGTMKNYSKTVAKTGKNTGIR